MDIKWKNSLKGGVGYIVAAGVIAAAIAMFCYRGIGGQAEKYMEYYREEAEQAEADGTEYFSMEDYLGSGYRNDIYRSSYVLYRDLMERREDYSGDSASIFLPSVTDGTMNADDSEEYRSALETLMSSWTENFLDFSSQVGYYAVDGQTGNTVSNILENKEEVQAVVDGQEGADGSALQSIYGSWVILSYDGNGDVAIESSWNLDADGLYRQLQEMRYENYLEEYVYNETAGSVNLQPPMNIKLFFGMEPIPMYTWTEDNYWTMYQAYSNGGFSALYPSLFILTMLGAAAVAGRKREALAKVKLYHLPVEISFWGIVFTMSMYEPLLNMCMSYMQGERLDIMILNSRAETVLTWLANFLVWAFSFGLLFWAAACIAPLFYMGPRKFLRTHSIIYRFFPFIKKKWKQFQSYVMDVDLTVGMEKSIRKITLINGIIVMILCVMWIGGIFGAIIYSVVLYIFLRKYFTKIRNHYQKILGWVQRMAQGDLNTAMEEDTGIFNPLKEELSDIQTGFKRAVDEEVKSQKMKTELITNVSHDLKTPLTAIITYVDLLKREDLTEEERDSYIRILEKKSLRLKALIEDLFEISKATTHNVQMHIEDVDLVNLMKQVRFEMEDKIQDSGLDFRFQLPDEKVILPLDSQKMYRVIENLMNNIVKYGLKGSRVYIDLKRQENGRVIVTMKNISATELNFDPSEITERFVRGDLSRNTEGSGLGLAIAQSFVELQGGTLTIDIDGDLFKAIIIFEPYEG